MHAIVSLDEKYHAASGSIFITGTQALVRLCIKQQERDAGLKINTAGFISGYRGSPLGNFDTALWRAKDQLAARNIVFQPGVNEEIAATSCWGSQQLGQFPRPKYDGVFAVWYGKGPGVDRSGDALKHGNLAGTSAHGGVLVLAGDDHAAKSSTTAHQSEQALIAAMIPVLYPATVQDYIDFGAFVFALSRFSGLWVSFKCTTEIVETSAAVNVGEDGKIILPDVDRPEQGLNIHPGFAPLRDEASLVRYRLPAAMAFVKANGLDRVELDAQRRVLGIVTAGKAYTDTLQALADLGIDESRARDLGVRLYKLGMIWPVEPSGLSSFAAGHEELLVIEEKRPVIEGQIATLLYNAATRPRLLGKCDEQGRPLLPSDGELSPGIIMDVIASRLMALGVADELLKNQLKTTKDNATRSADLVLPTIQRPPAFCSGCPHNTSTKLPQDSLGLAGIGCHSMVLFMPDRPTMPPTQMGGEGGNWIGVAPFTDTPHVFQNLGDGTYFHSGLLAVRAAIAAKVNITYKILYNDAVAMTGGQPVDGQLTVADIAAQMQAEGATEIVVVSDEPEKFRDGQDLAKGTQVHHRDELISVEQHLREVPGVTVLIYDQTCAAEKRRRRKRKQWPDPAKRYFINELVCEGCGDCSVQSSCVSIQALETEFGRKRRIDQSSCNKDYSCVKGFCPSFVTVLGGKLRHQGRRINTDELAAAVAALEEPDISSLDSDYAILIAGIGGTGVVTIGAILGMAARLEGLGSSVLDITGLSQKNGAVLSHVKLRSQSMQANSSRIGPAQTDLLIGCDLLVASTAETLSTLKVGRSAAVVNSHLVPTAAFQYAPDMDFQLSTCKTALKERLDDEGTIDFFDATQIAEDIFGNHILANMFLVGHAFQCGHIPIAGQAILKAIEINGVATDVNCRAFQLGRLAAAGADYFQKVTGLDSTLAAESGEPGLDTLIKRRSEFLVQYQDKDYARQYQDFIEEVRIAEDTCLAGQWRLTEAVARSLFRLMAYKDEYEVARLHTLSQFEDRLKKEFEGDYRIEFNFAPPLFASRDPASGNPRKLTFGRGTKTLLKVLKWGRKLRGTAFDIFGYSAERREERQLIEDYRKMVSGILEQLEVDKHELAIEIASVSEQIRGFGHVKANNIRTVKKREQELLARYYATEEESSSLSYIL